MVNKLSVSKAQSGQDENSPEGRVEREPGDNNNASLNTEAYKEEEDGSEAEEVEEQAEELEEDGGDASIQEIKGNKAEEIGPRPVPRHPVQASEDLVAWTPKTSLGRKVIQGKVTSLEEIFLKVTEGVSIDELAGAPSIEESEELEEEEPEEEEEENA